MTFNDWNIEEMTGYKPLTTYYMDFSIAEKFGTKAIEDTLRDAIEFHHSDIEVMSELYMVMNWKIWEHYERDEKLARLYNDLYNKVYETINGEPTFGEDEMNYFFRVTD